MDFESNGTYEDILWDADKRTIDITYSILKSLGVIKSWIPAISTKHKLRAIEDYYGFPLVRRDSSVVPGIICSSTGSRLPILLSWENGDIHQEMGTSLLNSQYMQLESEVQNKNDELEWLLRAYDRVIKIFRFTDADSQRIFENKHIISGNDNKEARVDQSVILKKDSIIHIDEYIKGETGACVIQAAVVCAMLQRAINQYGLGMKVSYDRNRAVGEGSNRSIGHAWCRAELTSDSTIMINDTQFGARCLTLEEAIDEVGYPYNRPEDVLD
jgi:hypothetical protein